MSSSHALTAARWIFGLFYALTGLAIAAHVVFGVGSPPSQATPAASAFTEALTKSGLIDPLLALSYIAGGLAMLRDRTAPLGIVLLAPAVAVIFCFHLALSGQWLWGSLNLLWLLALAVAYRSSLRALWNHAGTDNRLARGVVQPVPRADGMGASPRQRDVRRRVQAMGGGSSDDGIDVPEWRCDSTTEPEDPPWSLLSLPSISPRRYFNCTGSSRRPGSLSG